MEKRKLNRRDFLRLSALTVTGAALAACNPPSPTAAPTLPPAAATEAPTAVPQAAGGGTMVFWPEWGGKDADALKVQVDKFSSESGIKVDYQPIRDHARMIASISAGEPPDLLMTWDANAVGSWGFEGALKDLGPYIQGAKMDTTQFFDIGMVAGNLMGTKQIGIPLTNYITSVLYFNKDALTKAGLDPAKPPETWEDVWAASEKITVMENNQLKALGFLVSQGQQGHPTLMAYAYGGSIWSDDFKQVTPDSDANVEGLKWMQQFYTKYTNAELQRWISSVSQDVSVPTDVLYTGEGAMRIDGEWVPSFAEKLDPKPNIGMGWLPYPAAKPDVKGTMTANSNPMVIPTAAKNPDAGFKFVEFISKAENSAPMCVLVGNASPTKDGVAAQIAATKSEMYKFILQEMWTKGKIKSMTINSPMGSQYMDAYGRARDKILQDGADALTEMKKVKDEIQPQLDEALKKLGM